MTIAAAALALVAELDEAGIPDPLGQRFTLASTLHDLCRLAGEPVPAAIARALDRPVCLPVEPSRRREAQHPAFLAD